MKIEQCLAQIKDVKRIVIKIGTSTLTHETGMLNIRRAEKLVKILSDLKNSGKEIILVSSGAVGVGVGKLGLSHKPDEIKLKQAAAAVGQCELMYLYDKMFAEYSKTIAQILLTKDVIVDPKRKENAMNTFETLLSMNVIPIVNENDSISTDELETPENDRSTFGDNDALSAIVAKLTGAGLLVILSDIDGVYDCDPRTNPDAKLIHVIEAVTDDIKKCAGGAGSSRGTGGMLTKFAAASKACKAGIYTVITNGKKPEGLYDIFEGQQVGTLFLAKEASIHE